MSAVKAFLGVKAVDLVRHFGEVAEQSGITTERITEEVQQFGQGAQREIREFGEKVGEGLKKGTEQFNQAVNRGLDYFTGEEPQTVQEGVSKAHEVFLPHVSNVSATETAETIPPPDISQNIQDLKIARDAGALENIFDRFANAGEAPWDTGAKAGEDLASKINMGDLRESWMHGDIEVPRLGAFRNFFGHLAHERGPLDPKTALKMAENLRDALLSDQENYMNMAHLIRDLKDATNASELQEILTSMPKKDALKVAYYSYAEGLIKNPELKKVIVDFIKGNTQ